MRSISKLLTCSSHTLLALGAVLFVAGINSASATIITFDVQGTIESPILWQKGGRFYPTGDNFQIDVTAGDLVLTYDTINGITNIFGTTDGCLGSCGFDINGTQGHRGQFQGKGTFEWDLELANPLAALTEADGSEFGYGMQQAGEIRLLNAPAGVPDATNVVAKNGPQGFAWRAFDVGGGIFETEGWLQLMAGFVGGFSRFETGANNADLNWDLRLVKRDNPPTEVPEPATSVLLGLFLSLLFTGAIRKREKI